MHIYIYDFYYLLFFVSLIFTCNSYCSGFSFLNLTGTSDIELGTNFIFFDLPNLRSANSGAFRGNTLFYVLGIGLRFVKVVLGA